MCSLIPNANGAKTNLGRFVPFGFAVKRNHHKEQDGTRRRRDGRPEACGWELTQVIGP
jgi:hypothetical protein